MYQTIFLQVGGGGIGNYVLIPLMFLVLYLFMIRPQMKKQKNEKKFQSSIKKGAKVITTSGIHGKIVDLIDSDNTWRPLVDRRHLPDCARQARR